MIIASERAAPLSRCYKRNKDMFLIPKHEMSGSFRQCIEIFFYQNKKE